MLWRTSKLTDYRIDATDGAIGTVDDVLIEDDSWVVRWLVVDTGSWLTGRKVLLPPECLGHPNAETGGFPVDLTRQQVESSPGVDVDEPVSRQMESDIYGHYGWSPYWAAAWPGLAIAPGAVVPPVDETTAPAPDEPSGDPHLRSVRHVTGYHIHATDDSIGHVEEFLIDEDGWAVRYMIVDTRNWWPGRKVLVSPQWIRRVDWGEREVYVDISRKAVEDSPEFDPQKPVDRPYEELLFQHYRLPVYWI